MEDMIRYNEAIDQAIAESVGHFHATVERSRNLLLGMLGHDMRSPLQTIQVTAMFLAALNAGEQVSEAAAQLIRSAASMQALLNDLVDFNRTKLGLGLKIVPSDIDLGEVVTNEVQQLRGAHPDRQIELTVAGETHGRWDGHRLQQLLRNLVSNAIDYGEPNAPVCVALISRESDICLEVTNSGPTIELAAMSHIFDPLKRGVSREDSHENGGLGLGLYIVSEIAKAHGGEIEAHSRGGETTFVLRLPRDPSGQAPA